MQDLTVPIESNGAVVWVLIRPAGEQQEGIQTRAYLDTGASDTAVEPAFFSGKGFKPAEGSSNYRAPGGGEVRQGRVYNVEVALITTTGGAGDWIALRVIEASLEGSGCNVALGRDFLGHFHLDYNGPAGQATVRW